MSTWLLAGTILTTSFLGSWHCAGMCGPMATLMAQRKSLLIYHLGRLLSYASLGAIAGASGDFFLNSRFVGLRVLAVALMATILFVMGLKKIKPQWFIRWPRLFSFGFNNRWMAQLLQLAKQSSLILGLLTALLPCGWLYTYVLAAAATRSPWAGIVTLTLFWLGGLPALSTLPMMIRKGVQKTAYQQQKMAGVILIASSLYAIVSFMFLHS